MNFATPSPINIDLHLSAPPAGPQKKNALIANAGKTLANAGDSVALSPLCYPPVARPAQPQHKYKPAYIQRPATRPNTDNQQPTTVN